MSPGDVVIVWRHTDDRLTMNRWDHHGDCCRPPAKAAPLGVRVKSCQGEHVTSWEVLDSNPRPDIKDVCGTQWYLVDVGREDVSVKGCN